MASKPKRPHGARKSKTREKPPMPDVPNKSADGDEPMKASKMTALPPKPTHNFHPLRFVSPLPVSLEERRTMIELEAYFRAEARQFAPGHHLDDWLSAEMEVDNQLAAARKSPTAR